jgi:hypothetical protein
MVPTHVSSSEEIPSSHLTRFGDISGYCPCQSGFARSSMATNPEQGFLALVDPFVYVTDCPSLCAFLTHWALVYVLTIETGSAKRVKLNSGTVNVLNLLP